MVLEAVVYPQDPFCYGGKDLYNFNWGYQHHASPDFPENQTQTNYGSPYADWDCSPPSSFLPYSHSNELHPSNPSSSDTNNATISIPTEPHNLDTSVSMSARPKRRRARTRKNKEEIENQRMTHIAVERNRRKQMNDYLSVLRSLMPDSYVQRGDQASIIGGAINFVKELEQRLQFLGARKETQGKSKSHPPSNLPFSEFFTFPQYSTTSSSSSGCDNNSRAMGEGLGEVIQSGVADIEVTMVESHANLKIRSKKRPKQLLKIVSGLHSMRLTILHLNVTTAGEIVLYSLSVKVDDDCTLVSVDDIAAALFQMMDRIHQETMLN